MVGRTLVPVMAATLETGGGSGEGGRQAEEGGLSGLADPGVS